VEARNPFDVLAGTPYPVLINDISVVERKYRFQCGDGTQCVPDTDDPPRVRCGVFDGYLFRQKFYAMPDIPDEYPKYFYVGGATFPDPINVMSTRYNEMVRLIYKLKPVRLRCVLLVDRSLDIVQNVLDGTDIWQDVSTGDDIVQNYGGL
jgi:hypothetical protein